MNDNKDLPAFPIQPTFNNEGQICEEHYEFEGLTKREYFAGLAMQGLCASPHKDKYLVNDGFLHYGELVQDAIGLADALLSQLSKPQP